MEVDEIVGDQPAGAVERHAPGDVAGGIPWVDRGLLVEPPQVGLLAGVVVADNRAVCYAFSTSVVRWSQRSSLSLFEQMLGKFRARSRWPAQQLSVGAVDRARRASRTCRRSATAGSGGRRL